MLTIQEINALAEIITRAPASQAERLWLQELFTRLAQEAERAQAKGES
jgi:hypothetical protein